MISSSYISKVPVDAIKSPRGIRFGEFQGIYTVSFPSRKLTVGFRSGGIRWNRESSGGIEVLGGKWSEARGGKQILRVTMMQLAI